MKYLCYTLGCCKMGTHPCPCGYYGGQKGMCRCTPYKIGNYMSKISGPLLGRIDIHVDVPAVEYSDLASASIGETSAEIRERVNMARNVQKMRFKEYRFKANAHMSSRILKTHCKLENESESLLNQAMIELGLSARGYTKIIKVASTIADIELSDIIKVEHISEALQYRRLDRNYIE